MNLYTLPGHDLTETHDWVPASMEESVAFDEWLVRYEAAKAVLDGIRNEGADRGWAILDLGEDHVRLLDGHWVRKVTSSQLA